MSYTSRLTIAVPMHLLAQANQLALLIGQSDSDVNTFNYPSHTIAGVNYSVASTACTPEVIGYLQTGLPTGADGTVVNPHKADLDMAGEAFVAIMQGAIKVSILADATLAVVGLGATPIVDATDENV